MVFDGHGVVTDATINPEYAWGAAQPGPGCESEPDSHGYYHCRRLRAPVPEVDPCVLRAVRAARVPPFAQPSFSVNYPFRY